MTGVTLAQLESLAARAPSRAVSLHPARRHAPSASDPADVLERARRYLATIPPAIAGQRGHDRTFYAANRLIRGFALDPDAAYTLLAEWNRSCDPPWSEHELRRKLEQAAKQPGPRGFLLTADPPPPGYHARRDGSNTDTSAPIFRNYVWSERTDGETSRRVKIGRRGEDLVTELLTFTGGWPRRVGRALFARDKAGNIHWMLKTGELFAWIDWQFSLDGGRGFEWVGGPDCLSQEAFLEVCRIHCEPWDQVELFPHDPLIPGHFYHHPEVPIDTADGSHLTELVRQFHPHSPEDEDLIRLFFLTLLWGGPPRKRPIFLFEAASGSGQGSGKTTVAIVGSALVGHFISLSPKEKLTDIHNRLLSPEALTRRVILIDNLKALRFSDSDIEGLITTPIISGKQMYTGEGRRPNTFVWVVTSNKPSLSKDLAQRSVIIRVETPVYSPEWEKNVLAYIQDFRWQIIADCIRELRQPSRLPADFIFSRWAEWEHDVLSKAAEPGKLAAELADRRGKVDDDDETGREIADAIRDLVRGRGFNPDTQAVLIPSQVLYDEIVKKFGGPNLSRTSGLRWLYNQGVPGLSKHDANHPYRGGIWRPADKSDEESFFKWADRFGTSGLPE